jgi:hypothetical protein
MPPGGEPNPADQPGAGGLTSASRAEMRLEERALSERWPLSAAVRLAILKRCCGYIDPETPEGSMASARVVVAASRVVLAADRLNLDEARLDLERERLARSAPADGDDAQAEAARIDAGLVRQAAAAAQARRDRLAEAAISQNGPSTKSDGPFVGRAGGSDG